jgi:hypothetical protein
VWTSENNLEPVCPDVLINPVFQVLSHEGRAPGSLLIVNIFPALIKHSTPLSHIWLIHYTFPIHRNKLTFCAFTCKNPITARTSHSAGFSIFLLIFKYNKSQNDRIGESFTWLVTKTTEARQAWNGVIRWPAQVLCANGHFLDDPRNRVNSDSQSRETEK